MRAGPPRALTRADLERGVVTDAVEHADYQVLSRRVSVPVSRRLMVAVPGLVRARRTR